MGLVEVLSIFSIAPFMTLIEGSASENDFIVKYLSIYFDFNNANDYQNAIIYVGVGSILVLLISSIFKIFVHFNLNRYIENFRFSIGSKVFNSYLNFDYIKLNSTDTNELSKRLLADIDLIIRQVIRPVVICAVGLLVSIFIIIFLLISHTYLTIIMGLLFAFIYLSIYYLFKTVVSNLGKKTVLLNTKRFSVVNNSFNLFKLIKLKNIENKYTNKFDKSSNEYSRVNADYITISIASNQVIEIGLFISVISVSIFLFSKNIQNYDNALSTGAIFAFAAYRLRPAIQSIYTGIMGLKYGQKAISQLNEDIKSSNFKSSNNNLVSEKIIPKSFIKLEKINFSYPNSERLILKDINQIIKVGETIGVIGPTGTGKSTLIDIIMGFIRPVSGKIIIDDKEVGYNYFDQIKHIIGYAPQETIILNSSFVKNIAFGFEGSEINLNRINELCNICHLREVIDNLPEGLNTKIGEGGYKLSGGEKQRLGLARSLYNDPDILILDEFTSSLDLETEKKILISLKEELDKRTSFIISHRKEPLKYCDRILELE